MTEPWTAEDIMKTCKQEQARGNIIGRSQDKATKIIEWMNSEDPNWFNVIGMLAPRRPGAMLFLTLTEYLYFPPKSPKNIELILLTLHWMDMGYFVFSVPKNHKDDIMDLAPKCEVKLVKGAPCMLQGEESKLFPIHSDNTYTLENIEDHPVYKIKIGDLTSDNEIFKQEDFLIDKVREGGFDISNFRKGSPNN